MTATAEPAVVALHVASADTPSRGVAGLLEDAAGRWGARPFLRDARTGEAITFDEARARVAGLARCLQARGVRPGDRLVVLAENRVEVPLLVFAAARLGALFCVLHDTLSHAGVRAILADAEPRLTVLTDSTARYAPELGATPCVAMDVLAAEAHALAVRNPVSPLARAPSAADAAGIVFTSGSTGEPRGVVLSHGMICFAAAAIQKRLQYRVDDVVGLLLPFSFDYGLYQAFLTALCGAELVVGDADLVGPGLLNVLRDRSVSVLPLVPTLVAAILPLLLRKVAPPALPRLRAVTSTGEHLSPAHHDRLTQLLPQVRTFPMYGLTECKRVSILLPEERAARPESVGRPLDGTSVRVVNDGGETLPPGEVGELRVRGPHLALGYWRDPEATAVRYPADPAHGRELATGDYGWVDGEGYLYVLGRRDGVTKHRGFRISTVEIENAARRLPGVLDAAVVRIAEVDELHLFLVPAAPGTTPSEVMDRLRGEMESYKVPDHVHLVDEIPRRATGKADGEGMRALARARAGGPP